MKLDLNKDMKPWLETLNNNIKWGIALTIRIIGIFGVILLIIGILRWTGLVKDFKGFLSEVGILKIEADKPKQISKPTTPTHKNDLKDIKNIKEMLEKKLNASKKEKIK